jgi:IMP dehydrogenase
MDLKLHNLQQFGQIKVGEIMIQDPLYITPNEKISTTELLMLRKNIGGLPVVSSRDEKQLLGIITQRDIRLAKFAMSIESQTLVRDLMTSEPYVAKKTDTLKNILKKMFRFNIERLPVVNEQNQLVGLVLERNILDKLAEYLINE